MMNEKQRSALYELRKQKNEFESAIQALKELIEEGHLNWSEATKEMQTQTGYSLGHLLRLGVIGTFKQADRSFVSVH